MDSKSLSAQMKAIGDYGLAYDCHRITNSYVLQRPIDLHVHPQKLWITLWATHIQSPAKWLRAVPATD
jgi:hypothetical protein